MVHLIQALLKGDHLRVLIQFFLKGLIEWDDPVFLDERVFFLSCQLISTMSIGPSTADTSRRLRTLLIN